MARRLTDGGQNETHPVRSRALRGECGIRAQDAPKPNIVIIWGDDIGQFNISAYNHGMMGYKTPNIDSIDQQGCALHRLYGQHKSCTTVARPS